MSVGHVISSIYNPIGWAGGSRQDLNFGKEGRLCWLRMLPGLAREMFLSWNLFEAGAGGGLGPSKLLAAWERKVWI